SVFRHLLIGFTFMLAIAGVAVGVITLHTPVSALPVPDTASATPAGPDAEELAARERGLSRGEERTPPPVISSDALQDRNELLAQQRKEARKAAKKAEEAEKRAAEEELRRTIKEDGYDPTEATSPREIGKQIAANKYGWTGSEWTCYDNLIMSESRWVVDATNPSSGAYGIPQSLPGDKMASEGADWRTNPATQIKWGLKYVKERYGTPCSAWSFKQGHNWY
ncbi:MAG TPA: hypothetical protein IAA98_05845, partial [Candidatus Avipropionibacterium avicola]|nr:hypothetical protein [Candidatus Avipropionibacterium avicola]